MIDIIYFGRRFENNEFIPFRCELNLTDTSHLS